jgi:hypothetical protein
MYCPSCGSEESQPIQFCRSCGTNLRTVKTALQHPDAITASAVSAREEIGRAVASRINALERAKDLSKVAEEVLPQIEKFLESPEERRLRRIRAGVLLASLGLGATLFLLLFSIALQERGIPWPVGLVPFFIGIGMVVNGLLFTLPPARSRRGDGGRAGDHEADQLEAPSRPSLMAPPSVVESTTELLEREASRSRRRRDTH